MRSIKFEMIYNAVFKNPVVRYLTAAAPGLDELTILGKIESLHREAIAPAPKARFDLIFLDAPHTATHWHFSRRLGFGDADGRRSADLHRRSNACGISWPTRHAPR